MKVHITTALILLILSIGSVGAAEPVLLSDPNTASQADRALVLVHGLLGSPSTSFGNWPEIIAKDHTQLPGHGMLSDFAIYAVDYEADFKTRATLEDVATGVANDLAASEIFKRHRHIWFVAHSMGGLVLKRTLALWQLHKKTVLIDRIMGIAMLGVPTSGSPLADLVHKAHIDSVARWFGWNGDLVSDLTTDAGRRYLDSLETDWMAIQSARNTSEPQRFTPRIVCGYELGVQSSVLERAFGSDIATVAPKLFAGSACDEKDGFPVKHTDLPKPADAAAPVHGWLRNLIEISIVKGLKERRYEMTTAPPSEALSFLATRVEFMNRDLDPVNFDQATGLPVAPERIEFADERSDELAKKLVLGGGPFYGATKADLWERVGKANTCLEVGPTPNRMTIRLRIAGELQSCIPNVALMCPGQPCG